MYNCSFGSYSLFYSTTGNYNVAMGYSSLNRNVSGSGNVAIGHNSGHYNLGNNNTFLGQGSYLEIAETHNICLLKAGETWM